MQNLSIFAWDGETVEKNESRNLFFLHFLVYNRPPMKRLSWKDVVALAAFTVALLATYARVLFTSRIPASGDFIAYFAPYWDYLNRAISAGRLPLWNDAIFGGAPFQANPQTAVFYPLRWPMFFLSAEKGILLTAAVHAWLAGVFAYVLVKTILLKRASTTSFTHLAALVAACIIALNGWVTGLLLHPNQFSVFPWLIAAILLWENRPHAGQWPQFDKRTRRWLVLLTGVWSLAFLAGHTQSFYNAGIIFGIWVLGDLFWRGFEKRKSLSKRASFTSMIADQWPLVLAALVWTGGIVAVQLLPTLDLSTLSYRQGGLSFREHAALSLPPWRLGFSLLPHYARDLGMALGTEAYAEWVGYVGLSGLILAALGWRHANKRIRFLGVLLTLSGLVLAFGAYTPVDFILYTLMPGWDLFRVPARFLAATVIGIALLAALGVDVLANQIIRWRPLAPGAWPLTRSRFLLAGMLLVGLALAALTRPNGWTLLGWSIVALFFVLVLRFQPSWPRLVYTIPLILFLELYGASYTLPIQHPTPPQALRSWRTAPARIAAELGPPPREHACRTLSLSPTTWDPGDLNDLRTIYGPYTDDWAFTDLINATKAKEVLAPNLGMIFQIPSLDGFGGGVLPTARFVKAMSLFLPPDQVVADGRLREQLSHMPDTRLLSLFNVCYVIIGKNFDVWHNNIYYDLAFGEILDAAEPELIITDMPNFPASGLGIVSHLGDAAATLPPGTTIGEVIVTFENGAEITLPLRTDIETAVGRDEARNPEATTLPAVRWPYHQPGQDVIAELDFPAEGLPPTLSDRRLQRVHIRLLRNDVTLFIRGMAIFDRQSGAHATPIVTRAPWQRIHSGDVKIYRNDDALPRAFAVTQVVHTNTLDEAVARMTAEDFDPRRTAVLDTAIEAPTAPAPAQVTLLAQSPERLRLQYHAEGETFIVIADAWHPGWRAILDPDREAIPLSTVPTDIFLRGLVAPPGDHEILLVFEPASFRLGGILSALSLVALFLLWVFPERQRRQRQPQFPEKPDASARAD